MQRRTPGAFRAAIMFAVLLALTGLHARKNKNRKPPRPPVGGQMDQNKQDAESDQARPKGADDPKDPKDTDDSKDDDSTPPKSDTERAKDLGYTQRIPPQKAEFDSHGQTVYYNPKTKTYISRDIDGHNTSDGWKMFDRKGRRIGTYDSELNRLKD
ncbi:toxin C-terminal domain-containing protein [Glycomyces luteolus]|uniref:Toxin C-terminal domain-containing protein n=1 Tax=Glycomyces luteolus TaxID=2670330 RepID=A0A9X3PMV9_9ACTN|nr:toxin C-terminal domain-containing protein [Glycomyces luteolus]MDA1361655.1 toxin C-terminal domain-containing protein [Glycomyces luteolus]